MTLSICPISFYNEPIFWKVNSQSKFYSGIYFENLLAEIFCKNQAKDIDKSQKNRYNTIVVCISGQYARVAELADAHV